MSHDTPILLSFYALSNGQTNLIFGQLAYSLVNDFSFKQFSWRKTFRTLVNLYQTRTLANQEIELRFDNGIELATTDKNGSFQLTSRFNPNQEKLESVNLRTGGKVVIVEGLYPQSIHHIDSSLIVVSDIDDTLLHSFIRNKLQKFKTLMFTRLEKRRAVDDMMKLLKRLTVSGAAPVYLSNSEQNLYPLIYRFLQHNEFPQGPLFLKNLRKIKDVILNQKWPPKDQHKEDTLKQLIQIFSDKKFVLIGDNTQNDLTIYLKAAKEFPANVQHIIIREVYNKVSDRKLIDTLTIELKAKGIGFYYAENFPTDFAL